MRLIPFLVAVVLHACVPIPVPTGTALDEVEPITALVEPLQSGEMVALEATSPERSDDFSECFTKAVEKAMGSRVVVQVPILPDVAFKKAWEHTKIGDQFVSRLVLSPEALKEIWQHQERQAFAKRYNVRYVIDASLYRTPSSSTISMYQSTRRFSRVRVKVLDLKTPTASILQMSLTASSPTGMMTLPGIAPVWSGSDFMRACEEAGMRVGVGLKTGQFPE